MDILYHPFGPLLIAVTLLIAAVIFGHLEASDDRSKNWLRESIVVYAVPSLVIALVGSLYSIAQYDSSDISRCRDMACKAAARADADFKLWLHYGAVELISLMFMGGLCWLRTNPRFSQTGTDLSLGGVIVPPYDQKKWKLDPESGEFYLVKGFHNGSYIVDAEPYRKRFIRDYQRRKKQRANAATLAVSVVLLIVCFFWFVSSLNAGSEGMLGEILGGAGVALAGLTTVVFSISVIAGLAAARIDIVGPAPIQPPGKEAVAEQKIHGLGGFLEGVGLTEALGGGQQRPINNTRKQQFDD